MVIIFSLLLISGIVAGQVFDCSRMHEALSLITSLCLSYIMIEVGLQFSVDKRKIGSYGWDSVVTSSVKIAGVLLVFSFLVVPSVCAILLSEYIKTRLLIGWIVGFSASILGMAVSYYLDLPTGASVVCAFGIILMLMAAIKKAFNPKRLL